MNPCCGCIHCHHYARAQGNNRILHVIDCLHFNQPLSMPDTHTKFYCRYFESDE